MSKIIEFPSGNKRSDDTQPLDQFLRESFDSKELEGVKGAACVLLMEDGEVGFVVSHLNWAEVLWCAAQLAMFATGDEEDGE